jgi:hypothetical protein
MQGLINVARGYRDGLVFRAYFGATLAGHSTTEFTAQILTAEQAWKTGSTPFVIPSEARNLSFFSWD